MLVCKILSLCHVMPCQDSDNSRHDSSQRVFSFKASQLRNAGTKCPFVRSRISKGCTLMFLSRIWGACIEIKYYRWGLHAVLYVAILSPISSLVWLMVLYAVMMWPQTRAACRFCPELPGLWSGQPDPNTKPGKIYKYKQIQSAKKRKTDF